MPAWQQEQDPGCAVRDAELLYMADPVQDSRVVLIGPDTIGLLCELIRRGCLSAATVRLADRPEAGTADVALVPCVVSVECANAAVAQARRALAPLGRLALRLAPDPSGTLVQATHRAMLLHGFSAIRLRASAGRMLLSADLPLHGQLARA